VVLITAWPVFGSSFGYPNEVVNGGFESGDFSGWDPSGTANIFNSGDWGVGAPEGEKYAGAIASWAPFQGGIIQWIDNTKSPGWDPNMNQKEIDLEFNLLLHDRHSDENPPNWWENTWMRVVLDWYDNSGAYREVELLRESNATLLPNWTGGEANAIEWAPVHIDYLIEDAQPEEISLHFEWWKVDSTMWGYAFVDGIDLESRCVPEPATALLLSTAITPLLLRRRH
jgi:hypothetical protein